jgi:hypothetical protein
VKPGGVIALAAYTRQSVPGQIYDLVNSLFRNPTLPAALYYAWSEGAVSGQQLDPYFQGIQIRVDGFDTCFPS